MSWRPHAAQIRITSLRAYRQALLKIASPPGCYCPAFLELTLISGNVRLYNRFVLKIGEFSALAQVSIRTLRHYDEVGLLKPTHVEAQSGYRYYSVSQLPRLHRILALATWVFRSNQVVLSGDEAGIAAHHALFCIPSP